MSVLIACLNPSCGQPVALGTEHCGDTATCQPCGKSFRLRSTVRRHPSAAERETALDDARTTQAKPAAKSTGASRPHGAPGRIGRFEVRARLGAGAFGTVYRAYDPQLDRDVALKVPQAGSLESKETIERFLREAKAAAKLRHPAIVAVHEAGNDGTHYYIAAEFIAGRTLAQASEERALTFRKTAKAVRELAEALHYAHELGIVHRDSPPVKAEMTLRSPLDLRFDPQATGPMVVLE